MTHLDHSSKPIDESDNPDGPCPTCRRPKSRHTFDEMKACKIGKYANSGEMAGTRHTRK